MQTPLHINFLHDDAIFTQVDAALHTYDITAFPLTGTSYNTAIPVRYNAAWHLSMLPYF